MVLDHVTSRERIVESPQLRHDGTDPRLLCDAHSPRSRDLQRQDQWLVRQHATRTHGLRVDQRPAASDHQPAWHLCTDSVAAIVFVPIAPPPHGPQPTGAGPTATRERPAERQSECGFPRWKRPSGSSSRTTSRILGRSQSWPLSSRLASFTLSDGAARSSSSSTPRRTG